MLTRRLYRDPLLWIICIIKRRRRRRIMKMLRVQYQDRTRNIRNIVKLFNLLNYTSTLYSMEISKIKNGVPQKQNLPFFPNTSTSKSYQLSRFRTRSKSKVLFIVSSLACTVISNVAGSNYLHVLFGISAINSRQQG